MHIAVMSACHDGNDEKVGTDFLFARRIHAASVLQMIHLLIHNGLTQKGILDGITMLACYHSGVKHYFEQSCSCISGLVDGVCAVQPVRDVPCSASSAIPSRPMY